MEDQTNNKGSAAPLNTAPIVNKEDEKNKIVLPKGIVVKFVHVRNADGQFTALSIMLRTGSVVTTIDSSDLERFAEGEYYVMEDVRNNDIFAQTVVLNSLMSHFDPVEKLDPNGYPFVKNLQTEIAFFVKFFEIRRTKKLPLYLITVTAMQMWTRDLRAAFKRGEAENLGPTAAAMSVLLSSIEDAVEAYARSVNGDGEAIIPVSIAIEFEKMSYALKDALAHPRKTVTVEQIPAGQSPTAEAPKPSIEQEAAAAAAAAETATQDPEAAMAVPEKKLSRNAKIAIGVGIGAVALGLGYLAYRWFAARKLGGAIEGVVEALPELPSVPVIDTISADAVVDVAV